MRRPVQLTLAAAALLAASACSSTVDGTPLAAPGAGPVPSSSSPPSTAPPAHNTTLHGACPLVPNTTIAKQFHTKSVRAKENPVSKVGKWPLYACTYKGSSRTIVVLASKYRTTNGSAQEAVDGFIKGAKGKHPATVSGVGDAASSFEFAASPGHIAVGVAGARKEADGILAISVFTPKSGKVLPALVATTKLAMH